MDKIIKDLRSYALENYAKDGWDILVECYDDEDIMQDMDGATNLADGKDVCTKLWTTIDRRNL